MKVWVPIALPEGARVRDIIVEVGPGGPAHTRILEPLGPVRCFEGEGAVAAGTLRTTIPQGKWDQGPGHLQATPYKPTESPPKFPQFYANNPSSELNGAPPPEPQRERWEYRSWAGPSKLLAELGAEGWEAYAVSVVHGVEAVWFKRRLA